MLFYKKDVGVCGVGGMVAWMQQERLNHNIWAFTNTSEGKDFWKICVQSHSFFANT